LLRSGAAGYGVGVDSGTVVTGMTFAQVPPLVVSGN
jgi:hypothetical protein